MDINIQKAIELNKYFSLYPVTIRIHTAIKFKFYNLFRTERICYSINTKSIFYKNNPYFEVAFIDISQIEFYLILNLLLESKIPFNTHSEITQTEFQLFTPMYQS